MHAHVVSLFPEYFQGPFECGPTRVARQQGELKVDIVNPRDFTVDAHRTVDDYPFGGGAVSVLKPEPLYKAIDSVRRSESRVILLTPQGRVLDQQLVEELSCSRHLVLVCGRYKDFDDRVRELVDDEVSVGDYVLAGGEAAAVCLIEAIARLLPGAVGDEESVATDSFTAGLLDAPYFTRPREFNGRAVPDVLVTGDHAAVRQWRREQALRLTASRRPGLLRNQVLTEHEREFLCRELGKEVSDGKESS
jgi:tRNA (guanine37-N1)-methyltransferase